MCSLKNSTLLGWACIPVILYGFNGNGNRRCCYTSVFFGFYFENFPSCNQQSHVLLMSCFCFSQSDWLDELIGAGRHWEVLLLETRPGSLGNWLDHGWKYWKTKTKQCIAMLDESEELGWLIASTLDRSGHSNGSLGDWLNGTRSLVGTQSAIAKHQTDAMAKTKADDVQLSDKKRHFAWLKKKRFYLGQMTQSGWVGSAGPKLL